MASAAATAHADDLANPFDGFVYVLGAVNSGDGPTAVEAYGRERLGGQLDHIGRAMTGGTNSSDLAGLQQNALASDGRHVYAVNTGSNTLSALAIGHRGDLSFIQQVSSGGLRPVSIAIYGNHLYVANAGATPEETPQPATVVGFTILPNGALARSLCQNATATPGDLFNVVADLAINPSGTTLVLNGLGSNKIDSFAIDLLGCLHKRTTLSGGGGAFGVKFRPGTDELVVTRALPELFTEDPAPGVGSYRVSRDGRIAQFDQYVDPDKSDVGLRDPCWIAFAQDGVHFWTSSFIPRSLNAFSLDHSGKLTRVSEYQPGDSVADPSNPGATLVVGSLDLATDRAQTHLYQIRAFEVPDGAPLVPGSIRSFEMTGDFSRDAGLRETRSTPLPADMENASVTGLVFVDRTDL
jgi:6-phosphogluconolactonase (cycloisomerase 2 family)